MINNNSNRGGIAANPVFINTNSLPEIQLEQQKTSSNSTFLMNLKS